jgi:hypothetical protein
MMVATARDRTRETRSLATQASVRLPSPRVVIAIAGIETRKILIHPAFLSTMAVMALFATRAVGSNANLGWLVGGLSVGLAAGGFISVNLATQRARRDRVLELFGSLPAPAESRTFAVLLAAVFGPVALSALVAGIGGAILETNATIAPYVDLALIVQISLTVAALNALGVALGRWIPSPVTAPVVLVAMVVTGLVWIVPWVAPTSTGIHMAPHFIYLVSFVVLASALALVRDRRTPLRLIVTGVAFGLTVYGAANQLPPGGLI